MLYKTLSVCALTFLFFTSCEKPGCTNELATNYSEKAKTNDGSCQFETTVSFWLNESISATLVNSYNVTNLNLFIDEKLVGTIDPNHWTVGPDCGGENFSTLVNLGLDTIQTSKFIINDQAGTTQFFGEIELLTNNCYNIQMKW